MTNLFQQEPWELRGANDGRLASVDARVDVLETGRISVTGAEAALVGTPTLSSPFKLQGGTVVATTSLGGDITLTFPTAFPTGLLTFVPVMGFTNPYFISVWDSGNSNAAVNFRVYNHDGSALASTQVRIDWLAVGW